MLVRLITSRKVNSPNQGPVYCLLSSPWLSLLFNPGWWGLFFSSSFQHQCLLVFSKVLWK